MNGWVFDIAGSLGGMTVWFRTTTGETIALFAPFRPSFVLAGNRLKEPALRAAAARWKCDLARVEGIDFLSGRPIPAWSFTVPGPALLGPSVRKAEKAFGPEALCNADISPEQQFSFASGLYPCRAPRSIATATGRSAPPGSSIRRGTWTRRIPPFRSRSSGWKGRGTRRIGASARSSSSPTA